MHWLSTRYASFVRRQSAMLRTRRMRLHALRRNLPVIVLKTNYAVMRTTNFVWVRLRHSDLTAAFLTPFTHDAV